MQLAVVVAVEQRAVAIIAYEWTPLSQTTKYAIKSNDGYVDVQGRFCMSAQLRVSIDSKRFHTVNYMFERRRLRTEFQIRPLHQFHCF